MPDCARIITFLRHIIFFIIKTCACEYLLKIGDALCNTTTWTRFRIYKRIKKAKRILIKFIIAQYLILYAKKRCNIRRKKLWRRFHAPLCAASLQPYCSCTMAREIYAETCIPDEAATIKRERCRRQYMPILRMRIRTGKTRRQNVFSPMRMLFRISADYAPLWNTCAAALCRIKIFRNKSVRKKHLILTFNHFALSIEPASGRQQEDGDGFLFPNPRDGKYRKHLITHFFNKKTSGIQEIASLIWGRQCRLSLCRSLLPNGQPMRQL